MGLRVTHASFEHYRNLDGRSMDFSERLTVLVGHNAVGKTNVVEALQLLTCGRSFRRPGAGDLVEAGSERGRASLAERGDGRIVDLELLVDAEGRTFRRNGKNVRPSTIAGELVSILFCPDDLAFAKGSPRGRRSEMDDFGRQVNKPYGRLVSSYEKAVEQRNRLLREPYVDENLLAAWNESVAAGGARLLGHRRALFGRLRAAWKTAYRAIAPGEEPDVTYHSSLGDDGCLSQDDLQARFLDELRARRDEERRRGMTVVGPHRDDLLFTVNGRDARTFCSQGQQRSVVLAWKMAEVEVVEQVRAERPLLLLDDVMSELDEGRRAAVASFVDRGVQMVVTTTNLGYFSHDALADAEVVSFDER